LSRDDIDAENMLGSLAEEAFVWGSQCQWFEHVARATIALEHRMIDHVSQVASLPVDCNKLRPSTPITMRFVIRRIESQTLWINSDQMCPVVLDQIMHALLQDLVRRGLREGKQMFRCVLFLLVDPTTFDTYCVDKESNY